MKVFRRYVLHIEKYGEDNTTLERIDVNKGYCKENCRWATRKEQSLNKRNTVIVELNGESYPLSELTEKYNINYQTIYYRYAKGLRGEDLICPPKGKSVSRNDDWF